MKLAFSCFKWLLIRPKKPKPSQLELEVRPKPEQPPESNAERISGVSFKKEHLKTTLILEKIKEFKEKQDIFVRIKEVEFEKQKKELEEFQQHQQEELKVELVRIQQKQLDPIMHKIEELKKKQLQRLSKNQENVNQKKPKIPKDLCVICLERPMIIGKLIL